MKGRFLSTDAEWQTDAEAPDPITPDQRDETLVGCEFALLDTKHLGPFEHDGQIVFRTIWTWNWYKVEETGLPIGSMTRFDRVAPNADIADVASWPIEEGEPGDEKSGKLVKLQATRDGDRVTVDLAFEFDAERLKSVLPIAELYTKNPGFPESWREKLIESVDHIRTTIDGGVPDDRH